MKHKKAIMCFSGLDSTGGAGIQADIEVCQSLGVHCCPVITALTVQNSTNAFFSQPVDSEIITEQAKYVLNDMSVQAFKVGLVTCPSVILSLKNIFLQYPDIPVIFDPVLSAGGGFGFSGPDLVKCLTDHMLPSVYLLTPNTEEALQLVPHKASLSNCVKHLTALGCQHVLVTGTDTDNDKPGETLIKHRLFSNKGNSHVFELERLTGSYHGSGCTLASAISCFLALGEDTVNACQQALTYTIQTLKSAHHIGQGQLIPNRAWNK